MTGGGARTPADFSADRALLAGLVREAGALALAHFRRGPAHWTKGGGEPVSEADVAVDALLRERLLDARPGYGWLSEESGDDADRLDRDLVWIVDPIDGTRAFLAGRPEFAVAAALAAEGRPVCGCVFNPATGEFFEATRGGGARLNGETIRVTDRRSPAGARLLATARSIRRAIGTAGGAPAAWDAVASVAYRMALVARGRYDATLSLGPKSDWDLAAADLIVAEAGGLATDREGRPYVYNRPAARQASLIAANPALHEALVEAVARIG